jgi:hypothetical protein
MKRDNKPARSLALGLLLLLGAFVLVAAASALARQQPDAPEAEAVVPHLASEKPHFFITSANYTGAQADTSCPAGYHMASLWEMMNPSERTYASSLAVAKTRGDQGSGPVAGWWGWVRTGVDGFVGNEAGRANCAVWTSTTAGEYGTIVRLAENWTSGAIAISPWQAQTWSCTGVAPVWCASDPVYGTFAPVVAKQ